MGIFQTLNIPKNSYIHIYIYIFKNDDVRKCLINNNNNKFSNNYWLPNVTIH